MKVKLCVALLALIVVMLPQTLLAGPGAAPANARLAATQMSANLPLSFEPAQTPGHYLAHSGRYAVLIGATESSVVVTDEKSKSSRRLGFALENANAAASIDAIDPLPSVTNYYRGNTSDSWRLGVKNFAKLRAKSIYPGVDVVYYGDQRRLEFDFVVAPKADPTAIALTFSGMDKLYTGTDGDLVAETGGQPVRFAKPVAYQMIAGQRKAVSAEYALIGGKAKLRIGDYDRNLELVIDPILSYSTYLGGTLADTANGIAVDQSGNAYLTGQTCSSGADSGGLLFPAPSPNPSGTVFAGSCDAYISKLAFNSATNTTTLLFTTFIGGSNGANPTSTAGNGIALDNQATPNVYVIGTTNFWGLPGAAPNPNINADGSARTAIYNGGDHDAFIMVLNSTNGTMVRSTYLGGSDDDQGYAIAVDSQQNVTAVGQTKSFNFPFYNGFQPMTETYVAFVTKLDAGLHIAARILPGASAISPRRSSLTDTNCSTGALCPAAPNVGQTYYFFSAAFGGQLVPPPPTWPMVGGLVLGGYSTGFAVPWGAITIGTPQCGNTTSPPLVLVAEGVNGLVSGGLDWDTCASLNVNSYVHDDGGFSWRILGEPVGPVYATTEAYGVALDPNGDVFAVGGSNTSSLEPANIAWLPGMHYAGTGAWIIKLRGIDGWPVYLTPLGTNPADNTQTVNVSRGVAVDSQGRAYVVGTASGGIYTQATSVNPGILGGTDAFVLRMSASGSGIDYGTYLGGSGNDQGLAVAVDSGGWAYVTGSTQSANLPLINPLLDANLNTLSQLRGVQDAYVAKLTPDGTSLIMSAYLGGSATDQGNAIALSPTGSGDIYLAGGTGSVDFPLKDAVAGQTLASGGGDAWAAKILGTSFPSVTINPTSLNFGQQVVGFSSSTTQTVTIKSTGQAFLTINSITASGDFTQANNCGQQLTPAGGTKDTCTVTLTFTPTAVGTRQGTLTIKDDAPDTPQSVGLTGQGVMVSASITPAPPGPLSFGTQTLATVSAPQTVTVTNTDSSQSLIMGSAVVATVGGGNDFQLSSNNCTTLVAPGKTCTIGVTFTPSSAGSRSGTLVVNGNGNIMPATIQLTGIGNGSGGPGGGGGSTDFTVPQPAPLSVGLGKTGTFNMSFVPTGGFNQTISLTCTILPASLATCSAAPSSVPMDGSTTQTSTVTVNIPSGSSGGGGGTRTGSLHWGVPFGALPFCAALTLFGRRRRRWVILLLVALALVMVSSGCGGGGGGSNGSSSSMQPGAYTVSVTATYSGGTSKAVSVPLTVTQ